MGKRGALLFLGPWLFGCAISTQMTLTHRSALEQRLLFRSLERAATQLDSDPLRGKRVAVDFLTLADAEARAFAREFLVARLREGGVQVVSGEEGADLRLKVFASVLGVNQSETLLGLPSFIAPVVGLAVPEFALYRSVRTQGRTELQAYVFDGHTGEFRTKTPWNEGKSQYNQYKILILINFTLSDLDQRVDETPP